MPHIPTAVERWQMLIDARAQEMDALYAKLGRDSSDFWDRRACGFHRVTRDRTARDPFLLKVQHEVTPGTTVLDVGAGTGRFSLALAPITQHVTALEPNASMLDYLRRDASEQKLSNISYVQAPWEDAPADLQADIVLCSHVLYPIRDIVPFLAKLDTAARLACYIYLRVTPMDALTDQLWRHFHGSPRRLPPGCIEALDVLYEMGIYTNVEVVALPPSLRYPSLDVAVEEQLEQLILPDNEHTRNELRTLLQQWLIERDGLLVPPVEHMPSAIIWWKH